MLEREASLTQAGVRKFLNVNVPPVGEIKRKVPKQRKTQRLEKEVQEPQ